MSPKDEKDDKSLTEKVAIKTGTVAVKAGAKVGGGILKGAAKLGKFTAKVGAGVAKNLVEDYKKSKEEKN